MRRRFFKQTEAGIIFGVLILIVLFSILDWDRWTSFITIRNLTRTSAILGFLALGEALLILNREIDLSVGSVYGIVGITFVTLAGDLGVTLSILVALLLAIGIGLLHAVIVIWGRLPSMIVTLGGLFFYRGIIYVWTGGTVNSLEKGAQNHWLTQLFGGNWFLELVNSFWWFLLVAIILSFVLTRTPYGNHLFAIGGDPDSAKTRGVSVNQIKLISFVLCSFLAGLGGIMTLANDPNTHVTIGQDLELQAIAAAVIGGVSLSGGRGSIIGPALGAFFLIAVRSEMIALGAPSSWYISFVGAFLVFAVIVNTTIQRRFV
jgi:simple sugar transport system permease protein/ribose transport system permease protein